MLTKDRNSLELRLISLFRRLDGLDKTEITKEVQAPWSTTNVAIDRLVKDNILFLQPNTNNKYKAKVYLNANYQIFVGWSIGNSMIKLVFVDYAFQLLSTSKCLSNVEDDKYAEFISKLQEYNFLQKTDTVCQWCCQTPESSDVIRDIIAQISLCITQLKSLDFNIVAMGFAFPDQIDFYNQRIVRSFTNKKGAGFINVTLPSLLTATIASQIAEKQIQCFIDHNVKCSTVAEKEALVLKHNTFNDSNLIVAYLGYGLSVGLLLDNAIYRGGNFHNTSGEFGKCILDYNQPERTIETIIRDEVFHAKDDFESLSSLDLTERYLNTQFVNDQDRQLFLNILSVALYNICNELGVEKIVFAGKFDNLFPHIERSLLNKFEEYKKSNLSLINSYYGEYSAAVGAAMSCFYHINKLPLEWSN